MYRTGERIGYPQHDRAVSLALLPGHEAYATGVIPSWTKCCTPPGPNLGSRLSLPRAGQVCLARVIAYALPHFLGFRRALSRARHPAHPAPVLASLRLSQVVLLVKKLVPWVGKISWRRKWQPTPVFLPGESHGQEEIGGLQSTGSQRVGNDWSN